MAVEKHKKDFLVSNTQGGITCWSENLKVRWTLSAQALFDDEVFIIKSDPKHDMFTTVGKGMGEN